MTAATATLSGLLSRRPFRRRRRAPGRHREPRDRWFRPAMSLSFTDQQTLAEFAALARKASQEAAALDAYRHIVGQMAASGRVGLRVAVLLAAEVHDQAAAAYYTAQAISEGRWLGA